MSTLSTSNPMSGISLDEEARSRAIATAAGNERTNRPLHLVIGASALLLIALISTLWAWSSFRAARTALIKHQTDLAEVSRNAELYQALKTAAAADSGRKANEREDGFRSTIARLGVDVGLKLETNYAPGITTAPRREQGTQQIKVSIAATNETLQPLLAWVQRITQRFPGLELYKITIIPQAQRWSMEAIFTRWEKTESK